MVAEAKTILQLPVKNTLANTDQVVVVSNAAGSNGGNCSLVTLTTLTGNSSAFIIGANDPANSSSWVGPPGALFFSNTYGYISTANNYVLRFPLSSF